MLKQEVSPKLIRKSSPIAQVNGSTNIIAIEGEEIGTTVFSGPGAGMGPTASSVAVSYTHLTLPTIYSV